MPTTIASTLPRWRSLPEVIERPEAVTEKLQRDSLGNIIKTSKLVNGVNQITHYDYNGLNQVTKITDADNNTQAFEYNSLGNRTFSTAKDYLTNKTHTTQYESNNLGWNAKTTDAQGRVFTTTYDAVGNIKQQVENGLRTTTHTHDVLNRKTQVTTVYGADTLNTITNYDEVGNITIAQDAEGNTTQYRYDELNRRKKVIDAKNQDTEYKYDPVGNLKEVIDTPTRKTFYTYDNRNRRTEVKDAENIVTRTAYNEFGEAIAITQNYGSSVTRTSQYEYDKLGRKKKTIDPLNHTTTTTYDEADNVRTVKDANSNTTTYDYDDLNRQTKIIDANNITTQINTYDGFGNIKSIKDASGNLTQYDYDKLDRLTKTIDPRSKETTQSYDGLGRVREIVDRNNRTRTFAYDINDNLLTEKWGGTAQLTYAYDKVGNRISSKDGSSNTTNTYGYDAIYQLTSAATSNSNVRFEYTYDEFGDLTQRRDKQGTLTIAQLDYTYNNNHQLTRLIQSGVGLNTQTIEMGYDRLSQLKKVDRSVASNPGHLVTDYQYDGAGRLFDIVNKFNTTPISHYTYGYDDGNRLSGKSGTDGISALDYGRDNQISAVDNASRPDESYSFNALGIRAGWLTDPLDSRRVLNDGKYQYQYDDEGNLTQKTEIATSKVTTYEWDYRNRLMKVTSGTQTVEYGYDAEDKRVSKKINGVTTQKYVYDGADIALVVDAAGTIVERYLFGAGVDNVLSVEKGGAVVWSLSDRQGSVVDLVDAGGTVLNHFVYDSFGGRTATTGVDFRFGYTGRELDGETGLYYYRARYYDPTMGRFISEDPMGFSAGDTNLYRYVNNNPTNYTDPTGTTLSGWGEDLLYGVDSFAAGFANVVSFGITNKIRSTNKLAVENQQGLLYDLGGLAGFGVSLALNPAGAGASVFKGFATAYQNFGIAYGVLDSTKNVLTGQGSAWDLLNLAPAAGALFRNRKAIGGAVMKAGDAGADAVWRGIDRVLGNERQPQLILANGRRAASAATRVDDIASHQLAMTTGGGGSGATPIPSSTTNPNGLPTQTFTSVDDLNRAANAPLVNRASQNFEQGGYTWTTDAQGRVAQVEGTISRRPANGRSGTDGVSTTVIGKHADSNVGDVGFHLIGDQFNGPTNWLNVVPGNGVKQVSSSGSVLKSLNLSRYKTDFEHVVKDLAAIPGNVVEVKVKPIYNRNNSSLRPNKIETSYRVNGGSWTKTTFKNKAGG